MKLAKLKLILPTLGDLANGVFAVTAAAYLFETDLQWWHLVAATIFSLLPDVDALPELFLHGAVGKKQVNSKLPTNHRSFMHYPALYLIFGLLLYSWDQFWGVIFIGAITLHFLRDVLGTGWGIKLLWPMSYKNYKFMSSGANSMHSAHSFADSEIPEIASTQGNSNWLEDTYLRFTWISCIEYTLFVVAVGLVAWHLLY